MSKKRKKLLKFNFLLTVFLGFLIFTLASFTIVSLNENKNKNSAPKEVSCESLELVEEEVLKIFPSDIFIAKDLTEASKAGSLKMIILENQTRQSALERLNTGLDIPLLGYGIYKKEGLVFEKKDYEFSIYFDNPYDFINDNEIIKLPENSVTLILKCEEE